MATTITPHDGYRRLLFILLGPLLRIRVHLFGRSFVVDQCGSRGSHTNRNGRRLRLRRRSY